MKQRKGQTQCREESGLQWAVALPGREILKCDPLSWGTGTELLTAEEHEEMLLYLNHILMLLSTKLNFEKTAAFPQ